MMKIVTPQEMSNLELMAYRDGESEVDFMEAAGRGVAFVTHQLVQSRSNSKNDILLLCGKGNNAGDAYVAGIYLLNLGYKVLALQIIPISECSALCQQQHRHFIAQGGKVENASNFQEAFLRQIISQCGWILDGLFGTGFRGIVQEPYLEVIKQANASQIPIIAIDIPSGLNGVTGAVEGEAIIARDTVFLGLPKKGFFFKKGWNHVGVLHGVNFGLPHFYEEKLKTIWEMLSEKEMKDWMPKIIRNRHKYSTGYVVGVAGSPGMPGAALLSSSAALSGGAGIVRLLHPVGMQAELAASPYELIKMAYDVDLKDTDILIHELNRASSTFIGPGIGRSEHMNQLLLKILPQLEKPCVIDADALYFLSTHSVKLPSKVVLTPHLGEMAKLLNVAVPEEVDQDFVERCQTFVEQHRITLVLKGAPSFILHPGEPILVNSRGDPGMATAGSGDVLTGLIAALLAQGVSCRKAAALGVYLHGVAGEHAAAEKTSYCMTASDIIRFFPHAFRLTKE